MRSEGEEWVALAWPRITPFPGTVLVEGEIEQIVWQEVRGLRIREMSSQRSPDCGQPMINHAALVTISCWSHFGNQEGFCQGADTIRLSLEGGCSWLNRCSAPGMLLIRGLLWGATSPATLVYMQNDVHSRKVPPEKWSTDRENVLQRPKLLLKLVPWHISLNDGKRHRRAQPVISFFNPRELITHLFYRWGNWGPKLQSLS